MKILTVVYNLDKGGTQRAAQVFAEAYRDLAHDSRVLSLYGLGTRYEELKNLITVWNGLSKKNMKAIEQWSPNIIHIHSHGPQKKDIITLIELCNNSKIIETNVFSKPSPWANKVDISFQLSHWAKWIFNLRGGKKYRSAIVPYPVKCNQFYSATDLEKKRFKNKHNIPQDAVVIGRIGQSFPSKWSTMLIDIFDELAAENEKIYLLVVNAPSVILNKIEQSIFKNRVVIVDRILGDKALSIAYSTMSTMVLIVEQGESFGMVTAESILSGTPVVALSTPWADNSQCEVVSNNVGGFIAHSAKGISLAIRNVIDNQDIDTIKTTGISHINQQYDYLRIANSALNLLNSNSPENSDNIFKILNNSIDQPNVLTKLLLMTNIDFCRRMTIYSTGYKSYKHLIHKIIRKLKGKEKS